MKALSHRQSVNRMREKAVHLHRHIKDRSLHSLVVVIRAEAFAVGHSQGQKPGLDIYLADVVRERFPQSLATTSGKDSPVKTGVPCSSRRLNTCLL